MEPFVHMEKHCLGHDLLKEWMRWRFVNDEKVMIYKDNWVPNQPLLKISSLPRLSLDTKVSHLINQEGSVSQVYYLIHFIRRRG